MCMVFWQTPTRSIDKSCVYIGEDTVIAYPQLREHCFTQYLVYPNVVVVWCEFVDALVVGATIEWIMIQ